MLQINGKMLVANFKQSMLDTFGLRVKVHQGFSMGQEAGDQATLAAARSTSAVGTRDLIALTGAMTVEQAEAEVRAAAGFAIQVLDNTGANVPNSAVLSSIGFREAAGQATAPVAAPAGATHEPNANTQGAIFVTGQKKLATVQSEFTAKFPMIGLMFFSLEEAQKSARGERVHPLPTDQTIGSVRTKVSSGELPIRANTLVGTLEARFRDDYGLHVQVCHMHGGRVVYTSANENKFTLSDINTRLQERGWGEFVYPAS